MILDPDEADAPLAFDDHSGRGPAGGPGVRVVVGDTEVVRLWYGTFDAILAALHDLWWRERRIGRLRLLADWVADRGVFDPEGSGTTLDDPIETRAALLLVRDRFARRSAPDDGIDAAVDAWIRALDAAIESDLPASVERVWPGPGSR